METTEQKNKRYWPPYLWVATLYFTEGIPYILVNNLSVVIYKDLGLSNEAVAAYTSMLYLPWVLKFLWGPWIDVTGTKRRWLISMQWILAAVTMAAAFALPTPWYLQVTLALFFLAGFASATNDIATDGYYMLGMSPDQQAFYVGIRSTFYRIATITGNGLLVVMAGYLNKDFGYQLPQAWSITLVVLAAILAILALVHQWKLPRVEQVQKDSKATLGKELSDTLFTFFQKPGIGISILFLLLYRLGEAQLVKIAPLFLKDTLENGGLGLDNKAFGLIYGTLGILALVLGGILGGILLSRTGLGRWVWTMLLLLNVPHLLYVYIAWAQVTSLWAIGATVIVEQFCYGFSFTFLGVFTLWLAQGKHKTAHYAFATALWAFSMMIPGSIAGKVQGMLGYPMFFLFITLCGIPAFLVAAFLRYDPLFGKKQEN